MKTKVLLAVLLFTVSMASYSQISKVEIVATGLTCSMCSNAINKQLKALAEVEKVTTDLNTNTFTVELKEGSKISPLRLKQSVEKAGFYVGSMILTIALEKPTLDDNFTTAINDDTYIFVDAASKKLSDVITVKVLDKGFVTSKEYKKLVKTMTKYPTYSAANANTFHLKLT